MQGGQIAQTITPNGHDGAGWQLEGVGDYSGSWYSELLWANGSSDAQLWQLNGSQVGVTNLSGSGGSSPGGLGGVNQPSATAQQSSGPWNAVIGSGDTDLVP